jgi:hypothetical protein
MYLNQITIQMAEESNENFRDLFDEMEKQIGLA